MVVHRNNEEESEKPRSSGYIMNRSRELKTSREEDIQFFVKNESSHLVFVVVIEKESLIFTSMFMDIIRAVNNGISYKS